MAHFSLISRQGSSSLVEFVKLSAPRPRPKKMPYPNSSMSVAQRLAFMSQGNISKKRSRRLLEAPVDEIAENIIDIIKEKGFV